MIIEIFATLEVLMLGAYIASFFTKNAVLWSTTLFLSGILMANSFKVDPYIFGTNIMIFISSLIFYGHDILKQYGIIGKTQKEIIKAV